MNEMAMVEYLLKLYAISMSRLKEAEAIPGKGVYNFHTGRVSLLQNIIQERFGCQIEETDTEYRAYNSVCSVGVRKDATDK